MVDIVIGINFALVMNNSGIIEMIINFDSFMITAMILYSIKVITILFTFPILILSSILVVVQIKEAELLQNLNFSNLLLFIDLFLFQAINSNFHYPLVANLKTKMLPIIGGFYQSNNNGVDPGLYSDVFPPPFVFPIFPNPYDESINSDEDGCEFDGVDEEEYYEEDQDYYDDPVVVGVGLAEWLFYLF
ncbi:MAG: hypothetical protein EZS28_006542 [Streblomastix strix]|uniref:Uncharacterized protein n=1 Tax=Streblomastix strix TaxID=222440 RepID=A0A5J4WSZ2_9EUKA|nr:MAG: hypothetical protein EZS28_006542 [Streblomastix strix]